jgi:hypothetical protein
MDSLSTTLALMSTLISGVALVGIAVGLLLQSRQVRVTNLQLLQVSNAELIRMAFDHPESVWDPNRRVPIDLASTRQWVLANWLMQHWQFGYEIKAIPEAGLRSNLAEAFAIRVRREWWEYARSGYEAHVTSRRQRRFVDIANAEYELALQAVGRESTTS